MHNYPFDTLLQSNSWKTAWYFTSIKVRTVWRFTWTKCAQNQLDWTCNHLPEKANCFPSPPISTRTPHSEHRFPVPSKLLVSWQFSGPCGVTKYGSGWRKDIVNQCLEFARTLPLPAPHNPTHYAQAMISKHTYQHTHTHKKRGSRRSYWPANVFICELCDNSPPFCACKRDGRYKWRS